LLQGLKSDRLGIIVFAGEAYTQLPITTDYAAAKLFLNTIDTDVVPTQGTNLASAIELAAESFDMESSSGKAVIIVTDGENHEPNALEAAESAVEKGIQIYTIGMGTPTGSPIPVYKNGKQNGFRQDNEGNTVISSLNEDMLRQLADVGNGMYIRANNANVGFQDILADLSSMEKQEFESSVYTDYEDRFQFFLGVAFIFLLLSLLISEKKSKWSQKVKLFES
jgi:Ca-activated chloride channel family protein